MIPKKEVEMLSHGHDVLVKHGLDATHLAAQITRIDEINTADEKPWDVDRSGRETNFTTW